MFFTYRQNNSGGSFYYDADKGISITVCIEADNAELANEIAVKVGLYFNGCDSGLDCDCCGDRWYFCSDRDATETPDEYGRDFTSDGYDEFYKWLDGYHAFVHYINGDIKGYCFGSI